MNVKNIKSFVDFYKSLEISTCIAPFPRFLDKKDPKKSKKTLEERNFTHKKDEKLKELIEEIKTSKCDLKDVALTLSFLMALMILKSC